MADEWVAPSQSESVPSFEAPPETLIVPDTPPEVLRRWEIERAVDLYHRSRNRCLFGGVECSETAPPSEVVPESEFLPPTGVFNGSEPQPLFESCVDSETQAPLLPFVDSETQPPSQPFADSEAQPPSASKVEYTENEKAMLLILLPGMKDFI